MKIVNFILSLVFGVIIMLLSSSLVNYSYNDLVREVVGLGLPVLTYSQIFVLISFIGTITVLNREVKTS